MKYGQNRISGVFLTEFYLKLKVVAASGSGPGVLDGEYPAGHPEIALLHLARPVVKDLLSVELCTEAVAVSLELLALHVVGPAFAQHVLYAAHVGAQLSVDLLGPDDGARDRRGVAHVRHLAGLGRVVLHLELLVQCLNVVLNKGSRLKLQWNF